MGKCHRTDSGNLLKNFPCLDHNATVSTDSCTIFTDNFTGHTIPFQVIISGHGGLTAVTFRYRAIMAAVRSNCFFSVLLSKLSDNTLDFKTWTQLRSSFLEFAQNLHMLYRHIRSCNLLYKSTKCDHCDGMEKTMIKELTDLLINFKLFIGYHRMYCSEVN